MPYRLIYGLCGTGCIQVLSSFQLCLENHKNVDGMTTNAIKHFDKTIVCWEMKYGEKQNRDRDSD